MIALWEREPENIFCCGRGVGLLRGQARHDTIARIVDSERVLGDSIVLYF